MDKNGYHTDVAMKYIWRRLLEDLTPFLGLERPAFEDASKKLLLDDIKGFREAVGAIRLPYWSTAKHFKAVYQLKSFTERYIFAKDEFTAEELSSRTWVKYLSTQERISTPINWDPLFFAGLLEEWRAIASAILGQYDEDEHLRNCRFAKKACVGHPYARRRLDFKVKGPITGSSDHLLFLDRARGEDPHLAAALAGAVSRVTTHLKLQLVPKSYKILRAIMPDTLAGSFYSYGLGRCIQSRLKNIGLDIDHLQERHRGLARFASSDWRSADRRLATLDLSSASDSITVDLLEKVLPRKWYEKVMFGRVSKFVFNDVSHDLNSACTMGLGHTFPLETLLFYVLVRGIMNVYAPGRRGLVSVYGDDIILPTWAVKPVIAVFRRLHLQVNDEKSFWGLCDFRESCGGDYFRGELVRPARPEQRGCRLGKRPFVAFLYKVANVLLSKGWDSGSLYYTLSAISRMISVLDGFVLSVPPDFPDESGLKVEPGTLATEEPRSINWGSHVVRYWSSAPHQSPVTSYEAWLWEWLRVTQDRGEGDKPSSRSMFSVRKRRRGRQICWVSYLADPGKGISWPDKPHTAVVPSWGDWKVPRFWSPDKD